MKQAHARGVETARLISKITVSFFKTLDVHATNLNQIMEEAHTVNDKKLLEFEKKFEVGCPLFNCMTWLWKYASLDWLLTLMPDNL